VGPRSGWINPWARTGHQPDCRRGVPREVTGSISAQVLGPTPWSYRTSSVRGVRGPRPTPAVCLAYGGPPASRLGYGWPRGSRLEGLGPDCPGSPLLGFLFVEDDFQLWFALALGLASSGSARGGLSPWAWVHLVPWCACTSPGRGGQFYCSLLLSVCFCWARRIRLVPWVLFDPTRQSGVREEGGL
jgi:hypothetical protein